VTWHPPARHGSRGHIIVVLEAKLRKLIQVGRLTVHGLGSKPLVAGSSNSGGPDVVVRVKDRLTALRIALRPDPSFGEAYLSGALRIEQGSLWDLLDLCGRNFTPSDWQPPRKGWRRAAMRAWRASHSSSTRAVRPAGTSRITTICRTCCSATSSTRTGNIPAPTSRNRT
jgi:hypothetical protein